MRDRGGVLVGVAAATMAALLVVLVMLRSAEPTGREIVCIVHASVQRLGSGTASACGAEIRSELKVGRNASRGGTWAAPVVDSAETVSCSSGTSGAADCGSAPRCETGKSAGGVPCTPVDPGWICAGRADSADAGYCFEPPAAPSPAAGCGAVPSERDLDGLYHGRTLDCAVGPACAQGTGAPHTYCRPLTPGWSCTTGQGSVGSDGYCIRGDSPTLPGVPTASPTSSLANPTASASAGATSSPTKQRSWSPCLTRRTQSIQEIRGAVLLVAPVGQSVFVIDRRSDGTVVVTEVDRRMIGGEVKAGRSLTSKELSFLKGVSLSAGGKVSVSDFDGSQQLMLFNKRRADGSGDAAANEADARAFVQAYQPTEQQGISDTVGAPFRGPTPIYQYDPTLPESPTNPRPGSQGKENGFAIDGQVKAGAPIEFGGVTISPGAQADFESFSTDSHFSGQDPLSTVSDSHVDTDRYQTQLKVEGRGTFAVAKGGGKGSFGAKYGGYAQYDYRVDIIRENGRPVRAVIQKTVETAQMTGPMLAGSVELEKKLRRIEAEIAAGAKSKERELNSVKLELDLMHKQTKGKWDVERYNVTFDPDEPVHDPDYLKIQAVAGDKLVGPAKGSIVDAAAANDELFEYLSRRVDDPKSHISYTNYEYETTQGVWAVGATLSTSIDPNLSAYGEWAEQEDRYGLVRALGKQSGDATFTDLTTNTDNHGGPTCRAQAPERATDVGNLVVSGGVGVSRDPKPRPSPSPTPSATRTPAGTPSPRPSATRAPAGTPSPRPRSTPPAHPAGADTGGRCSRSREDLPEVSTVAWGGSGLASGGGLVADASGVVVREFGAGAGKAGGASGAGKGRGGGRSGNLEGGPVTKTQPKKGGTNCGKGQANQNIERGLPVPSMVIAQGAWWFFPSYFCAAAERAGPVLIIGVWACQGKGEYSKNDLLKGGIDPGEDMQDETGLMDEEATQIEAMEQALAALKDADATCTAFFGADGEPGIFASANSYVDVAAQAARDAREHANAGKPADGDVADAQRAVDHLDDLTREVPDLFGDSAEDAVTQLDRQIAELKAIPASAQARKDRGLQYTKETVVAEYGRQDAINKIQACRNRLSGEIGAIEGKTKAAQAHLDEAKNARQEGEDQRWAENVEQQLFGTGDRQGLFAPVNALRSQVRDAHDDVLEAAQAGDRPAAETALRRLEDAANELRDVRRTKIEGQTVEDIYNRLYDLRHNGGATHRTNDIEHRLYKLLHNKGRTDGFYDGFIDMMDNQLEGAGGWVDSAERYFDDIGNDPDAIPRPAPSCRPVGRGTICR